MILKDRNAPTTSRSAAEGNAQGLICLKIHPFRALASARPLAPKSPMRNTVPGNGPTREFCISLGSRAMFNVSRSTGLYALLFCSGLLLTSQAYAFDLNGAWATGADQCKQVFVKKGDKISFAQFSEEFGGGFVADGNDVRSKTARCTITSRKETGDTIDFQAACASEIMATSVNLRLKILDANSVSAFSPIRLWQDWSLPFTVARCNCSRNCSASAAWSSLG